MKLTPAIFLDRDGTLMVEVGYCSDPAQVRIFPGVSKGLQLLRAAGFRLILVTNQSGIGRGYFTEDRYRAVQAEFERQILPARLDAVYFCPDHPDAATSLCRKPSPGMLLQAAEEHALDLDLSYMVGDKSIDIEAGRAAGCQTVLVQTGYGSEHKDCAPDFTASDFYTFALGLTSPSPSR